MAELKSFTILVIDDDQSVRATVCLILARSGFCLLEAGNAGEAQRIWSAQMDVIDLVLCDIMLPGMPGPDLVRDLFMNRPLVPVIFATGVGCARAAELTKDIFKNRSRPRNCSRKLKLNGGNHLGPKKQPDGCKG